MRLLRRRIVSALALLLLATPFSSRSFGMVDNVVTTLTVTDATGVVIPHATIWAYIQPTSDPLGLNGNDLSRIANRYRDSFEFATPFNRIVPGLWVTPMADANGIARITFNYEDRYGVGKKRPPRMKIGFVVLKRGYFPVAIDFDLQGESSLDGHVTLARDPKQTSETQNYMIAFERLRFELSDIEGFAGVGEGANRRIERIREELELAAQEAITSGDKAAAARIYARMQYLPEVKYLHGKPVGFSQSEPYSAAHFAYLKTAYELDPGNPYIAAEYLFRRGSEQFGGKRYFAKTANEAQRRAFTAFLSDIQTLMRTQGERIWPSYHQLYALWHLDSWDEQVQRKAIPLLEKLHQWEPKFETRDGLLQSAGG